MIFVSYAREDKTRVETLVAELEKRFEVFWDPELPIGRRWDEEIQQKLKIATRVLVVWSEASIDSRYVREEAKLALDAGKLVPLHFEKVAPPFGFSFEQSCDLVDWNGDAEDPAFVRLVSALEGPVMPPPPPPGVLSRWWRAVRRLPRSPAVRAATVSLLVVGAVWGLVTITKADERAVEGTVVRPLVVPPRPEPPVAPTIVTIATTMPPPTIDAVAPPPPAASSVNSSRPITPPPPPPPKRCCDAVTGSRVACAQAVCGDCGLKDCSKKP
jgi:hypothetical protein